MPIVDVIVAAHRGLEATRRCLESVLAAPVRTPFELVVVDDATPEPALALYLRERAQRRRITLVVQPAHHGFAAALNHATGLHRERDVVILHADAEVANDWLDRLSAHALERDVGAIAPMTNAAGSATYPQPNSDNPLPAGETVASLDARFARANDGESTALPALDGPCVYLRRACLAAVGHFDGGPLGSDYAVITDLCVRAEAAGFGMRLAGDVFVGHLAHVSFGEAAATLRARSLEALDRLYPAYAARRQEVMHADPARPFARRVDILRIAEAGRPLLVFVTHGWGGGIRRHINDLCALIGERATVLFLEPAAGDTVRLHWPHAGEAFAAYFRLPFDLARLAALLRTLGAARLHVHHVHGLPRAILDLPAACGLPYDCTLHDYYAICPQYHLVAEDGRYCGEPDAAGCAACLARRPGQWNLDIGAWRAAFERLLRGAERVIAPSTDVARRMARYFPGLAIVTWPHPEPAPPPLPEVVRVVTLGNLSREKGLDVVAACADDARTRRLPLTFRVLGTLAAPVAQPSDGRLSIHGQYDDVDLPRLLAAEKADVVWFPAQVPETYAYTLSVALAAGVPIVASALGALPERLAQHARSVTLPFDASAAAWNEALLAAARGREPPAELSSRVPRRVAAS